MSENLTPSQLNLGCQAGSTAACEDGVAPEGALQRSDGKEAEQQNWQQAYPELREAKLKFERHWAAARFVSGPFTTGSKSPDEEAVPADTVSAANSEGSLTHPDYEEKASELYEISWRSTTSQEAVAAISSALSTAFEEGKRVERGRCICLRQDAEEIASAIRQEDANG